MSFQTAPSWIANAGIQLPAAIVVCGPPASGKTTLAITLASMLHYAIADVDDVTGPLTREALRLAAGEEAGLDEPVGERLRAARYDTLLGVAASNLAVGMGVVLAAPFTAERSDASEWALVARRLRPADPDHDVALVYLEISDEQRQARLKKRSASRDRDKLLRPDNQSGGPEPVAAAIVLDGSRPPNEQGGAAVEALARLAEP